MDARPPKIDSLKIERPPLGARSGGGGGFLVVVILLLAAGAGWWFLRGGTISVKTAPVQVQSAGVAGGGQTLLNASGYVTTRLDATVSSKITGKVMEVLVEEGMKVEKNQVLARLDDSNVVTGMRLAESRLASARLMFAETEPMVKYTKDELQRLITLEGSRAVSNSDLNRSRADALSQAAKLERLNADIAVAERQVDEWKQQLDDTVIRAPFAGVVTTKDAQPGEVISPMSAGGGFTRTGICTLVDMASLEIEVDVGESFINRVTANQPVESTLDAYPDWKIPGKVIAIIPTADRQKATVKVRVSFQQLDPRILPQMGVKVAFQSEESATASAPETLLTIPRDALRQDQGRDIAWVVNDGKIERRAVTVANGSGDPITLTAGLSRGESVILNPPSTLADGATVHVESQP